MSFEIPYTGNLPWLVRRTVLFVVHGSRAYGTDRPDSDYDYKGVAVAPVEYRDGLLRFEQAELKDEIDAVIYDLRKFLMLAADCNPNIIEVLWVNDEDRLICSPIGQLLVDNRQKFLSKKALYTFRGYAMSQLKRIKTHRRWLLNAPTAPPVRADFGLPERTVIPADQLAAAKSVITKKVDGWEIDFGELSEASKIYIQEQIGEYLTELSIGADEKFLAAGKLLGYEDNFLDLLERERRYNAAQSEWKSYQNWLTTRNPARAELEAKYGYDTKNGMHLVRLMRMCREILTEGVVHVRRPDAEELKAIILQGAWAYDQLMEWAEQQDKELIEVAKTSALPRSVNHTFVNELSVLAHSMLPRT